MSHLIQDSIRDGSLVLYHDYRAGHALDLSGNGNHGTLINSPWFDRNGLNTTYLGNEAVQVAHSASINLTTFTVVALILGKRIAQRAEAPYLARKQSSAGNLSWGIYLNELSSPNLVNVLAASSSFWVMAKAHAGVSCYGCNIETGASALPLYTDGRLEDASLAGAITVNTNTEDLFIANYYNLNLGLGRTISSFLMFNKLLTADEHRQAYLELLK